MILRTNYFTQQRGCTAFLCYCPSVVLMGIAARRHPSHHCIHTTIPCVFFTAHPRADAGFYPTDYRTSSSTPRSSWHTLPTVLGCEGLWSFPLPLPSAPCDTLLSAASAPMPHARENRLRTHAHLQVSYFSKLLPWAELLKNSARECRGQEQQRLLPEADGGRSRDWTPKYDKSSGGSSPQISRTTVLLMPTPPHLGGL